MRRKKTLRGAYASWSGLWVAVLALGSFPLRAAGPAEERAALGFLAGSGQVWVDHQAAFPGTAIFAGDEVATSQESAAEVVFQSRTAVRISEKSRVTFWKSAGHPALNLKEGSIVARSAGRDKLEVNVLGATVTVEAADHAEASTRIASLGGQAAVIAERGHVEIHGAGPPVVLAPGKHLEWAAGWPQAGGQKAGAVSNEIPDETVQHQGQTGETNLKLNDIVDWEDVVRTLRTGRVRIALLDGSFLNVGARSVMRITRHDPQTQQTQIDLTLGRLRGEVIKLTQPNASFEVRTQTAVIGVVGTIFVIYATANSTRVFCIQGALSVRNLNAAIAGTMTLHAGEFASVPRGLPPTAAVRVSSARLQSEINQTQVGGPPVTAPGAPPGGAATTLSTATNAGTTAAGATSAAVTGVTLSTLGTTTTLLTQAGTSLQTAQTTSNQALTVATAAGNTSSTVNVSLQNFIQSASPAFPTSCGCSL